MSKDKKQKTSVSVSLTSDQYALLKRRAALDGITKQTILNALINAYLIGDISVNMHGQYKMQPPSHHPPLVQIEHPKGGVIEVDPDWGVYRGKPQVPTTMQDGRRTRRYTRLWGTRQAMAYLVNQTGRRLDYQTFKKLLVLLEIPKEDGSLSLENPRAEWRFTSHNDPRIKKLQEAIEDGTYDALVTEGLNQMFDDKASAKAVVNEDDYFDMEDYL